METHELQLNHENLSCCGPNCVFERLYIAVELRDNKVHTKTKDEITIDGLFKSNITAHFISYIQYTSPGGIYGFLTSSHQMDK